MTQAIIAKLFRAFALFLLFSFFLLQAGSAAFAQTKLIPYRIGDKWGYSDSAGKIVIIPEFDYAAPFFNGLAEVARRVSERVFSTALIDANGKEVIPFENRIIFRSGQTFFLTAQEIKKEIEWGLYDMHNTVIVRPTASLSPIPLRYGLFEIKDSDGSMHGVIDSAGHTILETKFYFVTLRRDSLLQASYSPDHSSVNGLHTVEMKNAYEDLYTLDGKKLTDSRFMLISEFYDGLALVREGEYFGYIAKNGKVAIPLTYNLARDFSDGFAVVKKKEKNSYKCGLIDRTGKLTIGYKYDYLEDVDSGIAIAKINGMCGLITTADEPRTNFEFDEINRVHRGIIYAKKNGKWMVINSHGKILSALYDSVRVTGEDDTMVPQDFRYGSLEEHTRGKTKYGKGYLVIIRDSLEGLVNADGKEILPPVNDRISVSDGTVIVSKNKRYALFDTQGYPITEFKYDNVDDTHRSVGRYYFDSSGILIYRIGNKSGLLHKSGKEIVPPTYNYMVALQDDHYLVSIIDSSTGKRTKRYGMIDNKGNILVPVKYDEIPRNWMELYPFPTFFGTDIYPVKKDGKYGYVGRNGMEYFRDK